LGLTQSALAQRLGVSYVTINRWENRQARPSELAWREILRLSQAHDVTDGIGRASSSESGASRALDFGGAADAVRLIAEAERLTYGHLFNPGFATETSVVDPLPHQRIAVYDAMLPQARLRFLLADDAGAGKTIMTGLYIREMLFRRQLKRVLIVPPAGLVGNWERELRSLFALTFRIISGENIRRENPFAAQTGDLAIVSIDTLATERSFARLQDASTPPYDLVVFDEAHKLSADRLPDFSIRKTERYRLAESIAGSVETTNDPRWQLPWRAHHLLLLTATPHMGKDTPYFFLWRLLLPDRLQAQSSFDAFPTEERSNHFIRRTKEEMVHYDGRALYPPRDSTTLSYALSSGPLGEQTLYDATTAYIQTYYNRARILNRSAARLAMSVFQRRLASSSWALLRSFERRLEKLDAIATDLAEGRMDAAGLIALQRMLDAKSRDVLDESTAEEETTGDEREENEIAQEQILGGVVATSLAEVETERQQVRSLVELARAVYEAGEESKFERLREVLRSADFRGEKLLIFTEHRDTLDFIVRRLAGLGFANEVAVIHGGMHYKLRTNQVDRFRLSPDAGGATYMVCTDAAAEGINLQFCWLMVNYDIPWNPARLEQRMGRIHRYKQQHSVQIVNLVAAETREGKVLKTLLEKLERIRLRLGSDKVFDVVGRVMEGVSLREYMDRLLKGDEPKDVAAALDHVVSEESVRSIAAAELNTYGTSDDVVSRLEAERERLDREQVRRLLPGDVRRFIERASPGLALRVESGADDTFTLTAQNAVALEPLWAAFEEYPASLHSRLSVTRPDSEASAIFLRPGEPVFEAFRTRVQEVFSEDAQRGAVFVDPYAERHYLFHLARVTVGRRADSAFPELANSEVLDSRLVGIRVAQDGSMDQMPIEQLLLLRSGPRTPPVGAAVFASRALQGRDALMAFLRDNVASPAAEVRRAALRAEVPVRTRFAQLGFDHQRAELAMARSRIGEKARGGDARARERVDAVRLRQQTLASEQDAVIARITREPDLIEVGEITLIAHALVVPTADPAERRRIDEEVEKIAVRRAIAYEEARGWRVTDVSTPPQARTAGLSDHPGFDLISAGPNGEKRLIEVKGRAGRDALELTENEWGRACTARADYWLYAVFDCATQTPLFAPVQDPFGNLLAKAKSSVLLSASEVITCSINANRAAHRDDEKKTQ
jgi:superfamily II DNA or RNA helicase